MAAALPRWKGALFAALTASLASGLGFVPVELVARSRERRLAERATQPVGLDLLRENPRGTGSYRLRPGLDLQVHVKGHTFRIRTNSLGMHWREVPREKPPRRKRVAFLGDSFTFGCWAPSVEQSFVGVFERQGRAQRVEALNFGVGGYGLADDELLLREEVLGFQPDWVIVAVFVGNDFRDTWLGLDKDRLEGGTAVLRPEVVAKLVPEPARRAPSQPSPPAEDPSSLRAFVTRFATFRLLLPALGWDNPWVDFRPAGQFNAFTYWSRTPPAPVALRARDAVLAALGRMDELTRQHGARLGVVALPYREQVYATAESGRGYDVQLPQAWLRVYARERGIPYLDLWPEFRRWALATGRDVYLANDIHFDGRGHELAGILVRDWFERELRPLRAAPRQAGPGR
jgi:lysophospholipase L1-like esterase